MSKKNKKHGLRRVGEVMDSLDSPHSDFDMTGQFMKNGAGTPAGPKASHPLLNSFNSTYEPVSSEHLAQEIFTVGRLREYFQAWIIPKMPDPLPTYLEELDCMGFPMRTSFDGSPCIMVRYRGAVDVRTEEPDDTECVQYGQEVAEVPVYTDDWKEDFSDLPPFEVE